MNDEYSKEINKILTRDVDTLASDRFESMDRLVKYQYFCGCGDNRNDHETIDVDHPLNSDSVQMIEILGCIKCDCKKYKEDRREEIDYSVVVEDQITGVDKHQITNDESRKLKERVFLLEYEKVKELLSLYYIFCGCSKPYCEACQIVEDFKLTV